MAARAIVAASIMATLGFLVAPIAHGRVVQDVRDLATELACSGVEHRAVLAGLKSLRMALPRGRRNGSTTRVLIAKLFLMFGDWSA